MPVSNPVVEALRLRLFQARPGLEVLKPHIRNGCTNYAFIIFHHLQNANHKNTTPAVKDKAGLELAIAQQHASDLLSIHHHPVPYWNWYDYAHTGDCCAGLLVPHNGFPITVINYILRRLEHQTKNN